MKQDQTIEPWSRGKILGVFSILVVIVLTLVVGFITTLIMGDDPSAPVNDVKAVGTASAERRDQIAAEAMMETTPEHWSPQEPTLTPAEPMSIPVARGDGPAMVASGFPHTPEGAIAQLAEIALLPLENMSLVDARTIFDEWSADEAKFEDWSLAKIIAETHAAAGTTDGDTRFSVIAQPVAGQVKGTDGKDWTLACVLFDIELEIQQSVRFALGHCERMEWVGGRWQIAAGKPPARAPSTWPGSQYSVDAGWRPFEVRMHD